MDTTEEHNPEQYKSTSGKAALKYDARGFTVIDVLPCLKGKPWDQISLAYVQALRPTRIRVTRGECTCDASVWRVTVVIDINNIIEEITQEVEVGLPDGIAHGHALREALAYGKDSPQVKWHLDAKSYTYIFGKAYKRNSAGESVEYPYPNENIGNQNETDH